jgi:hypothetical protein
MAFDLGSFLKMLGGAAPGLAQTAGGLNTIFGKQPKNPGTVANNYISQIPGQTKPYYQPYMDAGKGALSDLQNQYKDLLSGNTQNQLGSNFKESPGYQYNLQQALGAGNNASAAGGMLGTPMHQEQNMGIAHGLASQDYNNYMQNQIGLYGSGLHGEEGLNNQGFEANKGYADTLGNALSQQGAYGFAGQTGQNQYKQQGMSDIFGGLGGAASGLSGDGIKQLLKLFGV